MNNNIKENILEAFKYYKNICDFDGVLFHVIFNTTPKSYHFYLQKNKVKYSLPHYLSDTHYKNVSKTSISIPELISNAISHEDNEHIFVIATSNADYTVIGNYDDCHFLFNIVADSNQTEEDFEIVFTDNPDKTYEIIKDWFKKSVLHDRRVEFGIATINMNGSLYTSWYDYEYPVINIKKNYNDDLPYKKICDLVTEKDKSALMLFYGEPGTGKTSLIKHLITKYSDIDYVFLDAATIASVQQASLMSYFLSNQNTVFILEDCEKVLMDRDKAVNSLMPTILNITDGIIGDVLGIKLICTFNTSLSNIDKALLRKGRLSLKYEFKKLSKEKTNKLIGEEKDMTLADIYNYKEENDFSKKKPSGIGFG